MEAFCALGWSLGGPWLDFGSPWDPFGVHLMTFGCPFGGLWRLFGDLFCIFAKNGKCMKTLRKTHVFTGFREVLGGCLETFCFNLVVGRLFLFETGLLEGWIREKEAFPECRPPTASVKLTGFGVPGEG